MQAHHSARIAHRMKSEKSLWRQSGRTMNNHPRASHYGIKHTRSSLTTSLHLFSSNFTRHQRTKERPRQIVSDPDLIQTQMRARSDTRSPTELYPRLQLRARQDSRAI